MSAISNDSSTTTTQTPDHDQNDEHAIIYTGDSVTCPNAADYMESMILQASAEAPSVIRGPCLISLNEVLAADKAFIEVYFMRHPSEMIMDNEFFVREMNGAVISLLQQSPTAVGDSLAAIGESYVKDSMDLALVLNRKIRLLRRLRLINEDGSNPELVLMLLLALCGVELVDPRSDDGGTALSALIANASIILEVYRRQGKKLNGMAKYFVRGLARQDLLISLSRMQRTKIDPHIWLDEYSMSHADRLMGFTTTLAPILSKLSALAEDVSFAFDNRSITDRKYDSEESMPDDVAVRYSNLVEREATIRAQLMAWRPIRDSSMSIQVSRKFLLHAYAWRAAALLYLFRLFNRPGSSTKADTEALSMAYDIVAQISGSPQEIKLCLWPLFIAACEVEKPEDRLHVSRLFDDIHQARPMATTRRTKSFCVEQVWPARDSGANWDWMVLARTACNGPISL
ncbi:fungal-specific transcription factor domain-containing protein [Penicillium tannophilum]|nr:fungal-specific transcription factor domain-containing protein [Penicillium tannophilum]